MNMITAALGPALHPGIVPLQQLDLAPVRAMLMLEAPTGLGWDESTALEAELHYRQFLEINLMRTVERPVPSRLADQFWHAHILDTRRYREDCERVFGYFLDHAPGFGANGDEDERDRAYEETVVAGVAIFGGDHKRSAAMCGSSSPLISSECLKPAMCGSSLPV